MTFPLSFSLAVTLFIVWALAMIWSTRRRWNLIARPFKTTIHLHIIENTGLKRLEIDGRQFRKMIILPTEEWLYMAYPGLPASLMWLGRVLIPWGSLSDIYTLESRIIGIELKEYFIDTRDVSGRVKLKIPNDVANEILSRWFLKLWNV